MKKSVKKRKKKRIHQVPQQHPQVDLSVVSYQSGYQTGYEAGVAAGSGSYGSYFNGTSIIIPSYNQAEYLKLCIDSIITHTPHPYEIIVIDNASTDGTADYLHRMAGRIRYRILEENRGFAGAVNKGLMMAKGMKMLLLNNDTLVTENWLENMTACLESDSRIGMVGPVTNFISGQQRIDVPYMNVEDMPAFARENNVSDPSRWRRVDRLTGFCLLFRRSLWERTGYFDEGYRIGNYEDDDYNIRVKLQGYTLVIAFDSFIHHFGSVSMRALGEEQFYRINMLNEQYYMDKWGNPNELIQHVREMKAEHQENGQIIYPVPLASSEAGFHPQFVLVKGLGNTVYWLEHGHRRPLDAEGQISLPPSRLPLVDIRRWPVGEKISIDQVQAKWYRTDSANEGQLVSSAGKMYWLEHGVRRKVASALAASMWGMNSKPVVYMEESELLQHPEGLPIIAPVEIVQNL
ncbi:glycosyltransferase family 2 protein [Paenibacillus sp. GCM10012307]|uniref:Glycosyltransferase family 2 protein n=1 Tax=Paenibacillus roseus TaxID=2798579 RepID=A0A934MT25_9BACL|nr:glycosyltransferase family 2 protein [Paenibacillus roseus]MBJ6363819.1 glycosyltransferase family 2 protein [Paenibacillus roseus]